MKRETQNTAAAKTIKTNNDADSGSMATILDFSSTLKKLHTTVDPQLVRQRVGGRDRNGNTHMVEYVEWHTVADILDEKAPDWGHEIKNIEAIGQIITVTVAITIDGITREGIGTGRADSETGIKKAEHDALKRAAVKFGIARDLYKKELDAIASSENLAVVNEAAPAESRVLFHDAMSRTLSDMVTGKQLGMIRALGREADIDVEKECSQLFKCRVEELSKRGASELIEHLQTLTSNAGTAMRRAG